MDKDTLGDRIRRIRKGLGLNQTDFAKKLGMGTATAISKYEDNTRTPDKDKLIQIAKFGKISLDELLMDTKTVDGRHEEHKKDSFSEPPIHSAAILIPSPVDQKSALVDPAVQAMADIKEIFDSGDPILVPAIQANLNAFKRALLRERQFNQIMQENRVLKERLDKIEDNMKEFEILRLENNKLLAEVNRLTATYEHPSEENKVSNTNSKK